VNGGGSDFSTLINTIVFLAFMILLFTGLNQKFQMMLWIRNIKNYMVKIKVFAMESREKTIELLKKLGYKEDPSKIVDSLSEFFIIEPVTAEPTGLMRRLEHLIRLRERRFRDTIKSMIPDASDAERSIVEVAVEVTAALNWIYKNVRHFLLLGEKTRNWILIMQLELEMPSILRLAETYRRALDSFLEGTPIGDGIGPLIIAELIKRSTRSSGVLKERIVEDTIVAEVSRKNRRLLLVKAEGPHANVGRPGDAVKMLVERFEGRIARIIMIDAALKLEGEETGSVAEGVGAAIGDPGPEKFKIETVASEHGIPLDSIVIKESIEDALTTMKKEISDSVEKVIELLDKAIEERSNPGDTLIIVGVGNTVGIAQ